MMRDWKENEEEEARSNKMKEKEAQRRNVIERKGK